jgi:hypothetical protein
MERQMTRIGKTGWLEALAIVLVTAMALLQLYFALYAYLDPSPFAVSRGTPLLDGNDSDWVRIYASRTLFIVLVLGVLLRHRAYSLLAWAALFGTVMPLTDVVLAALDQAPITYVLRHLATLAYLVSAFFVLRHVAKVANRADTAVR